jgi:hypothetical protein
MNPETLKPVQNNPVEEVYSRLHFSPSVDIVEMNQDGVLRAIIPKDVEGIIEGGVEYRALFGIPSEQNRDTVLGIFKGSDGETYISSGEDGVEPFLFRKGTKLIIGRNGMYVDMVGANGRILRSRVDSDHSQSVIDGFGSQTSGVQLEIYLDEEGKLDVSDHSSNGTKAILPKSDRVAKFVNALKPSVSGSNN